MARCFRGRTCPYRLRDACWYSHDDDPVEDPPCRVDAATSSDLLVRVRRLERIVEQIGGVLVPQILKGDVEGFQQNAVVEQIVGAPAPQTWEPIGERVQNVFPEQIVGIPVPQLMEAVVEVTPQERVQNCFPSRFWVSLCLRSLRSACSIARRNACRIARRS